MTNTPAKDDDVDIFAHLSVSAAKSKTSDVMSAADRTTQTVKRLRDEEAAANAEKVARLRAFRKKHTPKPKT
ncbi:hypothetical protein HGD90_02205 [Rhodobacteraceae bacterium R_SAG7]|jgi:hypothetical protein|uniref:hypothetical protein n=1 Tax=Rhodobacterales TaxID=204455 RepID=UPI0003048B44|nr:hypothetical protein [Ruegeria sp. TM1040]NKW78226.1 hypothetical protein [Rhodobacteraceae bacterium R_SAG7]